MTSQTSKPEIFNDNIILEKIIRFTKNDLTMRTFILPVNQPESETLVHVPQCWESELDHLHAYARSHGFSTEVLSTLCMRSIIRIYVPSQL